MPVMDEIRREAVLPYPPEFLFAIAADIEAYPHFLPACERVRILRREEGGALVAEMQVGYRQRLRETWVSRVFLHQERLEIEAQLIEGPFSHLRCDWRFSPHETGGTAALHLVYQIANPILRLTLRPLIGYATKKLAESFEARARVLAAQKSAFLPSP